MHILAASVLISSGRAEGMVKPLKLVMENVALEQWAAWEDVMETVLYGYRGR